MAIFACAVQHILVAYYYQLDISIMMQRLEIFKR